MKEPVKVVEAISCRYERMPPEVQAEWPLKRVCMPVAEEPNE